MKLCSIRTMKTSRWSWDEGWWMAERLFNTNCSKPGTFVSKHHHYNVPHPPSSVFAAFLSLILIPPSLLTPSSCEILPGLPLGTEARVLSALLTLWPPHILFISWLPPLFSQPSSHTTASSSSINSSFISSGCGAFLFPSSAEECVFVVYSPSETRRVLGWMHCSQVKLSWWDGIGVPFARSGSTISAEAGWLTAVHVTWTALLHTRIIWISVDVVSITGLWRDSLSPFCSVQWKVELILTQRN